MMKLNMQLFAASKSTSFSESVDVANNKSDLSITITFSANNSSTWFNSRSLKCSCNGSVQSKNVSLAKGGKVSVTFNFTEIFHNNDGSKSIDWNWSITTGTSTLGTLSDSGTKQLTTIPRASEITALNADIGSSTIISISKKSSNFTTTIDYKFENDAEWTNICTKTASTTYGFAIPESFYNKIPNKKYGVCTLRAITYNGNTKIGEKTTTFNATANETLCKPTISDIEINDTNELALQLTGDNTKFIKYISTPKLTWNASAKNGATLKSQVINNVSATSPYSSVWADSFVLVVTDSRGFKAEHKFELDTIDYFYPQISASGKRQSSTSSNVILNVTGKFFKGDFSTISTNSATFVCKYREKTTDVSNDIWSTIDIEPTINDDGSFSLQDFDLGAICDYKKNWLFSIEIQDELKRDSYNFPITEGEPNHNWFKKNNINYFNVNGNITIKNSQKVIGAVYVDDYEEI